MIDGIAVARRLLVACDFDGTLAPLVDDPDAAQALPEAMPPLRRLAATSETWVAIISGRAYVDLDERFGTEDFILVGEHGHDTGNGTAPEVPLLGQLRRRVEQTAATIPGAFAQHKGMSVVLHYRLAADPGPAIDDLLQWAEAQPEVEVMPGKEIVELSATRLDKGSALETVRAELAVDATVFIGDDVTDEKAFGVLGASDVGVKVGPGPSLATDRVDDPMAVAEMLARLANLRAR